MMASSFLQPQKDELFIARRDLTVSVIIWYSAPCSKSLMIEISQGTVLYLSDKPRESASHFYLEPMYKDEFEMQFIPRNIRREPHYGGFSVICDLAQLDEQFERLPPNLIV